MDNPRRSWHFLFVSLFRRCCTGASYAHMQFNIMPSKEPTALGTYAYIPFRVLCFMLNNQFPTTFLVRNCEFSRTFTFSIGLVRIQLLRQSLVFIWRPWYKDGMTTSGRNCRSWAGRPRAPNPPYTNSSFTYAEPRNTAVSCVHATTSI